MVDKLGQGVDLRQNYRPYIPGGGIKQDHLLFHVYPRYNNDYLEQVSEKYEADLYTELDENEYNQFAKILSDE